MFKVDITEEVRKTRKATDDAAEVMVQEAQLLLEGDHLEEREVLKSIGLGHTIHIAEKSNSINLERKTFENEYSGETVMQEKEIKDISIKYDLKFLKAKNYKGHTDLSIGPYINKFVKANGISPSKDDFFLLAPIKSFNLDEKPRPAKTLDPVLFYKVPNNTTEAMYVMVHKWGNSFSMLRYARGLLFESFWSYASLQFAFGFSGALILTTMLDNNFYIGAGNIILSTLLGGAYTFGMSLIRMRKLSEGASYDKAFNTLLWNNINKR